MRRCWAATTCAVALMWLPAPSLVAEASPTSQPPPSLGDDDVSSEQAEGTVDGGGGATVTLFASGTEVEPAVRVSYDGSGRAQVTSNLVPVRVQEITAVPDEYRDEDPNFDGACLRTRTLMVIDGQEAATRQAYSEALRFSIRAIFPGEDIEIPPCVVRPGDELADPLDAFEEMLATFFEQLPRPAPVLNPDPAVTGLDTYLLTNRPLAFGPVAGEMELGGVGFDVTLWAEGAYTVDWGQQDQGEGEAFERVTGPHTIPGRDYDPGRSPDDDAVTHVYTTTPDGPLTVSVTDYWVVHYSIAGVVDDATIVAELEPVTVPLRVREYQAVIIDQ